jgi:hypothetical protein
MTFDQNDRILGTTHVFILRVWVEPREIKGASPEYRFTLEHIGSGEKFALTNITEIPSLILTFFEKNEADEGNRELGSNANHV